MQDEFRNNPGRQDQWRDRSRENLLPPPRAPHAPPPFPEANIPGHGAYPGPYRPTDDAPNWQGRVTHPTYGGSYPQVPGPPGPQQRVPVGYDPSRALQQHPPGQRPRSGEPHLPYPHGSIHQQNSGPMNGARSPPQGPVGVRNSGGSHSRQSANEPPSPFVGVGGFVRPQDYLGPVTARRSPPQRHVGEQNTFGGSYSHQSPNEPQYPLGFVHPQNQQPMTAAGRSPSQRHAGIQNTSRRLHSHQSTNEPQSSYPLGFVNPQNQQNQRPMAAARRSPPQRDVGVQNTLGGPHSQRTGRAKRMALVIGTNYPWHANPRFKLRHCVEDAEHMADFLCKKLGFNDIRLMTDKTRDLPTKDNILGAMRTLVNGAQPGDSFFFYFSGHGRQIKDLNGDELDGLDECICAMDYRDNDPYPTGNTPGLIVDDDMHEIMVKHLPWDCRLTAMFDSCHSGTALDLPHIYDLNGKVKPITHPEKLWLLREKESRAHVVSLGASKDNQRAVETHLGGALRRAFIECVRASGDILTYRGLLQSVRGYMINHGFQQRPQLSSSYEIDTNIPFIT